MTHRGPDDRGVWTDAEAGIALAQRRLSIIDLSQAGHQPMASRDGRYLLVYNGEIYNYRELREALEAAGRTFVGHSDTQVITEGCSTWGFEATLGRLNGMFAIALWDRQERRLYFARDRMGEKPLYYGRFGDTWVFGSELKALMAHPQCRPSLDPSACAMYFTYNYVPGPRSVFDGISKLQPGHWMVVEASHRAGDVVQRPYWSVLDAAAQGMAAPMTDDPASAIEQVETLLDDAVRIRLESDVPIGALLSGGIDSSLVVALMRRHAGDRVKTFSVGFSEKEYDESAHARRVAEYLGTEHTEFHLTPADALEVVPSLPAMYDEPFADSSQIPTYLIAKLARQHVTVALSGDAGDELFAGYHRYGWGQTLWSRLAWMPAGLRAMAGRLMRVASPAQLDALASVAFRLLPRDWRVTTPGDRIHKLSRVISARSQAHLYDALLTNFSDHRSPLAARDWGVGGAAVEPQIDDFVLWMSALDMLTYLPDDILVKVDRATMATSLESRAPFLDHRLVELSWRVPKGLKLRGTVGKWLTREMLYQHVPREIVDRPKQGFSVPLDQWLRGPLREWAEALLEPSRLAASGVIDVQHVRGRWAEHVSQRRSWAHFLWSVLMFEAWRETYVDRGCSLNAV